MQEDLEKTGGMEGMSVEEMFLGIQESYEAAQQRAQEENRAFARTEFFRMDKLGVYRLRVLPLAPNADGTVSRPGYEFPVHQHGPGKRATTSWPRGLTEARSAAA